MTAPSASAVPAGRAPRAVGVPGTPEAARADAARRLAAYAAALDACHERHAPGSTVASDTGWTVASPSRLPGAPPLPGAGGMLAAHRGPRADEQASGTGASARAAFCASLLTLHRETLATVLEGALRRLDTRHSEGAPLLGRQLVRGDVADVALTLSEAGDLLALPGDNPARRRRVHRDLVAAGRTALGLYGAGGFTDEGPGRLLHLAELLGNTYLHTAGPGGSTGHE